MNLLRATATLGSMTLLSRILGFARDIIIAHTFGAGTGTDAFFVAFKIPNFLRRLFAEGAFSQAFVPVFAEYQTKRSPDALQGLARSVTGTLGGVLLAVTLSGILAAPWVTGIFAPGFVGDPEKYALTVEMLRITFSYLFFISLTALAGGMLNVHGHFAVPGLTPVFLNLSLIGCALWLSPYTDPPVLALAWGVCLGGILQFAFQLPFLYRLGLLSLPRFDFRHPGVRRILRLMLPALFGVSVVQINLLIDTLIASFLVTGSISWLYYSDRLMEFPLGVFGIALGTVVLPSLSKQHAGDDPRAFSATLDWALRWVLLIGLPAALGLICLAGPILATLFQYGAFTPHDAAMARLSLMAYALGLPAFILIKVLAPGFYARQDTRTPVRIAAIAMLANLVLNLLLVFPLKHAGLALATSLAAFLNAFLLFRTLKAQGVYVPERGWGRLLLQVSFASMAMVALLLAAPGLEAWMAMPPVARIPRLLFWILLPGTLYLIALGMSGISLRRLGR
ncbi:MAG: murein biosynthesis integral membrane protein MurJ [Gammaproteobacteria bacterium]|nr:MAG: murein biosynthesis integral membrane protein MurJ [Gammaproteobacteria bacterium]